MKRALYFLIAGLMATAVPSVRAENMIGLVQNGTTNRLIFFDHASPGTATAGPTITGLQAGETLHGIDVRPVTNGLMGLGTTGRVYNINTGTGLATTPTTVPLTLTGASYGFDFNPTVDRIRITGNDGQNLRANPDTGNLAAADGSATGNVRGSAYTRNFVGGVTTTLFTIDATANALNTQVPPNNGTQVPVGPLGVDPVDTSPVGFDMSFASGSDLSVASLDIGGVFTLHSINNGTGGATSLGAVGGLGGGDSVSGLAFASVPEPSSMILCGMGVASMLGYGWKKRKAAKAAAK